MALSEHALYQHWSDNAARDATCTIAEGVAPDSDRYGPDALSDDQPALVAKIESTTGGWLIDSLAQVDVQVAALINHVFDPGADVKLYASNNLADLTGSPFSPAFTASFTIPDYLGSGSRKWFVNPWLDLTQVVGYDAAGFRYRLLRIVGNSQNIQLGQLWLGRTIRRFNPDVRWGVDRGIEKPAVENRTAGRVSHLVTRGVTIWSENGEILTNDNADTMAAALEAHNYDVDGRVLPWLLVPDGLINKCFLVRYARFEHRSTLDAPGIRKYLIAVEEVSRGLRPGV